MADISIQFHALPEELEALVREWARDFGLHATAMRFFPYEAVCVDPLDPHVALSAYPKIVLSISEPVMVGGLESAFLDANPDVLSVDIGRRTEKGLEESALRARTSDERALTVWRKVANALRKHTSAGAVAVDDRTGATSVLRSHRYTRAAKDLETSGMPMLTLSGVLLRLGQP